MQNDKNFVGESPLYIIATPIGNLSEFSPRAIEVLNDIDYVACEDTRVSGKLLSYFNIKKPLISCHEHNENDASERIINLIKEGNKVAFMSDAGYPCVSDPGSRLIKHALENNIKVSVISGPNAMLNALVASGLDASRFYFHGFLSPKDKERKQELTELLDKKETLIFYEAPHRITSTLDALYSVFGDRRAAICRELTKIHENIIRGTLSEFLTLTKEDLKGEMVIVVSGNSNVVKKEIDNEEIINLVNSYIKEGYSKKDAIKKASESLAISKNVVSKLIY